MKTPDVFGQIIEKIFFKNYYDGVKTFNFTRSDIDETVLSLGLKPPSDIKDVISSFRFRTQLPKCVRDTAGKGMDWIIEKSGDSEWQFILINRSEIKSNSEIKTTPVSDISADLVRDYQKNSEAMLLKQIRFNRLIDRFLEITSYPLLGFDEIYVGIKKDGSQCLIPLQAKGLKDELEYVQLVRDLNWCSVYMIELAPRPVLAKYKGENVIAMMEVTINQEVKRGDVQILQEKHYQLV